MFDSKNVSVCVSLEHLFISVMPIVSLCWHWNGFRHGSCPQHFKILSNQDGQYYLWPHKYFTSINELINHHRTNSVARDSRTVILLKDLQEVLFFSTFCNFFFLHFKGAYTLKKKDILGFDRNIVNEMPNVVCRYKSVFYFESRVF